MSHTKRHSLAITTGPKPLHLINNPNAPATAPHSTASFSIHSPPYSPVTHVRNPRRQSSISYVSSGDRPILSRSTSLLQRGERDKGKGKNEDRRSVFSAPGEGEKQRPPLTLAEKHADLLHFIAQKESKCLELRSQLAVHEAELLQLKRKWERIVNRGFERQSTPVPLAGSPTLVDGIKEGVQGMSRLLSSVSAPSYPPTPTPTPPLIRTHHPKPSTSTISTSSSYTSASKSTRFSLSSTSSIEEDKAEDGVLIVRDTGATPTMSPNPDWVREVQRKQLGDGDGGECIPRLSLEDEYTASATSLRTKKLRRRSGGVVPLPLLDEFASTKKERAALAPVSSIPGLGSLNSANGGWVESMGKKLGELRGGAGFTKSQKRASLLISDVSNTFLSALSSPSPQSSSSYNPSPSSSSYSPSPITPSKQQSLLDDDDDFGFGASPVLKPSPVFTKPMIPTRSAALEAGGVGKGGIVEEEDEWNW